MTVNLLDFVDDKLQVNFQQYDYYEIFGISFNANDADITKAYHKLSAKYHPDKNGGSAKAQALFTTLTEIKDALLDAEKRARYNSYLLLTPKYQAAALENKMTMELTNLNAAYEKNHNKKYFVLDIGEEISNISKYIKHNHDIKHTHGTIEHKLTKKYFDAVFTDMFDINNFFSFNPNLRSKVEIFCEKISTWVEQKKEPNPSIKRDAAQADLDERDENNKKFKTVAKEIIEKLKATDFPEFLLKENTPFSDISHHLGIALIKNASEDFKINSKAIANFFTILDCVISVTKADINLDKILINKALTHFVEGLDKLEAESQKNHLKMIFEKILAVKEANPASLIELDSAIITKKLSDLNDDELKDDELKSDYEKIILKSKKPVTAQPLKPQAAAAAAEIS